MPRKRTTITPVLPNPSSASQTTAEASAKAEAEPKAKRKAKVKAESEPKAEAKAKGKPKTKGEPSRRGIGVYIDALKKKLADAQAASDARFQEVANLEAKIMERETVILALAEHIRQQYECGARAKEAIKSVTEVAGGLLGFASKYLQTDLKISEEKAHSIINAALPEVDPGKMELIEALLKGEIVPSKAMEFACSKINMLTGQGHEYEGIMKVVYRDTYKQVRREYEKWPLPPERKALFGDDRKVVWAQPVDRPWAVEYTPNGEWVAKDSSYDAHTIMAVAAGAMSSAMGTVMGAQKP